MNIIFVDHISKAHENHYKFLFFLTQKKSKPLPLGSGRCFATSFFLAQKLSNKPSPKGDGKTKKVSDISNLQWRDSLEIFN